MTLLADLLATVFERSYRSQRPDDADTRPLDELTRDLLGASGEISGLAIAGTLLDRFAALDDDGKRAFFLHLARDLDIDPSEVRTALEACEAERSKASYRRFMQASEPPRQELIRRLNQVPGATGALVAMRADLLRLSDGDPELQALDLDFRHLFVSWFNRGFLVLRPINWQSPAHILEKIIAYEAVHAIKSWDDLRLRLQPTDRRCFAFFHPAMPDEPLIFVEVALTDGVPSSIQTLLDGNRIPQQPDEADTAVFYSISNCQAGLAGISFGNSLIKQVAADLSAELPGLGSFVTLSPIPGLVAWLTAENIAFDPDDHEKIRQLAALYLTSAKRRGGLPADAVARFHLGNGALVHAVHGGADLSAKGRAQSGGAMVNYLYDLNKVSQNHEGYASSHEVAASAPVMALAAAAEKLRAEDNS